MNVSAAQLEILKKATPEQIKATIDRMLGVMAVLAKFLTPTTQTDDAIVAALQSLADQPWVLDLLVKLFGGEITAAQFQELYEANVARMAGVPK